MARSPSSENRSEASNRGWQRGAQLVRGAQASASQPAIAVAAFRELVERLRYPQNPIPWPLTNFTFFAGAGFSKSWDPAAPVGEALFQFDGSLVEDVLDIEVLARQFGLDRENLNLEAIRQISYQVDMYEQYPDIRSRYIDGQNLAMIRAALRAATVARYAELTDLNYFDSESAKFPMPDHSPDRGAIMGFFQHLRDCADGSQFHSEGIRTNFVTTNYDYVIETILDNLVGPDDSFNLYTYRGVTPTQISGYANPKPTHGHWLASHLIKLNGGFEILRDGDGYRFEYGPRDRTEIREHPPVIMLPSREQNYSDSYFAAILPKAVRLMRETSVLVIVGYSMPDDDALMRFVIRQFSEEPEDGRGKTVFYIDPELSEQQMLAKLDAVIPTLSAYETPRAFTFRGTFGEFATQYMGLVEISDMT